MNGPVGKQSYVLSYRLFMNGVDSPSIRCALKMIFSVTWPVICSRTTYRTTALPPCSVSKNGCGMRVTHVELWVWIRRWFLLSCHSSPKYMFVINDLSNCLALLIRLQEEWGKQVDASSMIKICTLPHCKLQDAFLPLASALSDFRILSREGCTLH